MVPDGELVAQDGGRSAGVPHRGPCLQVRVDRANRVQFACPFRFSPQRRARHAATNPPIHQLPGRDMDADEVFGAPGASCIRRPTCRRSDRAGAFGIGMNSTGGTGPRREWVQRSSDSQSLTIPVARQMKAAREVPMGCHGPLGTARRRSRIPVCRARTTTSLLCRPYGPKLQRH